MASGLRGATQVPGTSNIARSSARLACALWRGWKVSNLGTPTFEQLRVFLAVVDSGSVAGAACKLNHAVLVITYGVANLESQLDLELFDHGHAQTATHGRRARRARQSAWARRRYRRPAHQGQGPA
ncbi:LysR family transcriptional regulator (plasmid) [Sinorhizobium kummerowiae]|uniref:LysR family transcriptional regulator n=1 Tax=Sinorhizobium kummerowiae TaxID=158892 RepID=A0ABY8T1V4_9HYPH|nr:LysR family transcriptional regulator [Sinorhizobium kummerowiae]WRW48276.1 LysR family transcriptional regulator [Sinorhizobium kummerowiae]